MLFIVLVSAVMYIIGGAGSGLYGFLAFIPAIFQSGNDFSFQVWRLVTWIFIPLDSNFFLVAIAFYFYYFIGSTLEREWGTGKFTIYYFSGVLLNVIYGFISWYTANAYVPLIPYYLNFSMLLAFATLFPDLTVRLFFVIPIKVKWLAILTAVFFLYGIINGIMNAHVSAFSALLPVVAIINYILFCGEELLSYIRPLKIRTSPQMVNFKKAAKQAKRDLAEKPYRHKCAVCGKTDTEYPDLEFRYCSRCNGYHCFCIDHINNHIHFE